MDWRKQLQEHLRDANATAIHVVVRLASDSRKEVEEAVLYVPDLDAAFDRIEQRIANARQLYEEHK